MSWAPVKLGSLCTLVTKGTTPTSIGLAFVSSGVPFLRIQDISEGRLDLSNTLCVDESVHRVLNRSIIRPGDFLITIAGTIGRTAIVPDDFPECNCNQAIAILRFDNMQLDAKFLQYWLQTNDAQQQISGKKVTATISNLSLGQIKELEVPLPPLAEQKRIAAILDKADALRRKRQQAIDLADQFLRSVFLEMFGDPVTNPKGWEVKNISEACLEIVDCVNRTAPVVDYETPYKMIRTTNVRNYEIDLSTVRYVEKESYEKWTRRLLPMKGDIVFTREAPAGEAGIIETEELVFLGQRTMHFRPDFSKVTSEFLLFELMGSGIKGQISRMSTGSTVKHLSVPECKKFNIRMPPIEVQEKFSVVVKQLKESRSGFLTSQKCINEYFNSVSQQAFSGEL